ncbi:hypothetical protein XENORESO_008111 [Xenotaenia resolanae]|uniref:Uncharacterized protein n=1 Tax=Xenotaenia resolanae TaxID=208358 RepID=A0ABV0X4F8_9TELE
MKGAKGDKGKLAPVDREEQTDHEYCEAADGEDDGQGREPTISDLANVLQAHIGQQKTREEQWDKEMERQDHRFKALQHQFSLFQMEVQRYPSIDLRPVVQDPAHSSAGLRPVSQERPDEEDLDRLPPLMVELAKKIKMDINYLLQK